MLNDVRMTSDLPAGSCPVKCPDFRDVKNVISDVMKNTLNDVPKNGEILRAISNRTSYCYELDI